MIFAYLRRYPWRPLAIGIMLLIGAWFMRWWTRVGLAAGISPARWWSA